MLTNQELTRVEPRTFVRRLLHDFDRFFDEGVLPFDRPASFGAFAWTPALEVVEKDHRLIARLDLPGVKKEEIAISIGDEGLRIEGERKHEEQTTKSEWHRAERFYGRFVRTVPLPDGVKAEAVTATFENGVLEVVVPLPTEAVAAPPRKIEIRGAEKTAAKTAA